MTAPTVPPPSAELPPRPRAGPAVGPEAPPGASVRELASNLVAGTPGRLRLFGAIGIVVCLAFGFVAFLATQRLHADISHARDDAAQLVRVQTIRTSIVKADANATNAFLVGGLEPANVRAQYDDGIATAARTLTEATSAKAADQTTLASVNRVLATYAGLIESARRTTARGSPSARPTCGRQPISSSRRRCPGSSASCASNRLAWTTPPVPPTPHRRCSVRSCSSC